MKITERTGTIIYKTSWIKTPGYSNTGPNYVLTKTLKTNRDLIAEVFRVKGENKYTARLINPATFVLDNCTLLGGIKWAEKMSNANIKKEPHA